MSGETDPPLTPRDGEAALAAEYVLGVLPAEERRQVTQRLAQDPVFAALVSDWEAHLSPLNQQVQPVTPPPAVKRALEARLFPSPSGSVPQPGLFTRLWTSLRLWRTLAAGGLAASAALAAILVLRTPTPSPAPLGLQADALVAQLAGEAGDDFVAIYEPGLHRISLSRTGGQTPDDQVPQLWLITGDEAPRPLGLLSPEGQGALRTALEQALAQDLLEGATLAISLEPPGGSPEAGPTGPVIAAGTVRRLLTQENAP